MPLIDLSHALEDGVATYPDIPAPRIGTWRSHEDTEPHYAPGVGFHFGSVEMVSNNGTWIDAPFHRYAHGKDLAELPLERLAHLDALVVRRTADDERAIGPSAFDGLRLAGRAVLIATGWSSRWNTPAYAAGGHPYLTRAAAERLLDEGVVFLGTDSLNVDDTDDLTRPVHSLLLANDVPIGEHFTNLAALPNEGLRLHAAPLKVRAVGTFPVRAYAVVD